MAPKTFSNKRKTMRKFRRTKKAYSIDQTYFDSVTKPGRYLPKDATLVSAEDKSSTGHGPIMLSVFRVDNESMYRCTTELHFLKMSPGENIHQFIDRCDILKEKLSLLP